MIPEKTVYTAPKEWFVEQGKKIKKQFADICTELELKGHGNFVAQLKSKSYSLEQKLTEASALLNNKSVRESISLRESTSLSNTSRRTSISAEEKMNDSIKAYQALGLDLTAARLCAGADPVLIEAEQLGLKATEVEKYSRLRVFNSPADAAKLLRMGIEV